MHSVFIVDLHSEAPTDLHMGRRKRREVCQINEEVFTVPTSYRELNKFSGNMADQEEEMLQLAIRQSLMEQTGGIGTHKEDVSTTEIST